MSSSRDTRVVAESTTIIMDWADAIDMDGDLRRLDKAAVRMKRERIGKAHGGSVSRTPSTLLHQPHAVSAARRITATFDSIQDG